METTNSVFCLWFVRENVDRPDTELLIGIYSTNAEAQAAIARVRDQPGFRDHPQGFEIHPDRLNRDGWVEGYVTVRYEEAVPEIDAADPIGSVFRPLIGLPAWGVDRGHGSMMTMEFGSPDLIVSEPIVASARASEKVRSLLARRRVRPCGKWHLFIFCCHWCLIVNGMETADSEVDDPNLHAAVRALDGQKLIHVEVEPGRGSSRFTFDLGGVLETRPYGDGDNDEQWSLYSRETGLVLSYRADGCYAYAPEDQEPDVEIWRPIPALQVS